VVRNTPTSPKPIHETSVPDEVEIERQQQIEKNQVAIQLLDAWLAEPETQEQKETWEYLRRVLDEDRLSDRKLFP
jgi:hypothetical protein